jgi:hypothetical protein
MARSFWDDLADVAVVSLAAYGLATILKGLSENRSYNAVQSRPYTVQDLRTETQIALNIKDAEIEQLRKRVTVLEDESKTLRPFSEFLKRKEKEAETAQASPSKPKLHLWR